MDLRPGGGLLKIRHKRAKQFRKAEELGTTRIHVRHRIRWPKQVIRISFSNRLANRECLECNSRAERPLLWRLARLSEVITGGPCRRSRPAGNKTEGWSGGPPTDISRMMDESACSNHSSTQGKKNKRNSMRRVSNWHPAAATKA